MVDEIEVEPNIEFNQLLSQHFKVMAQLDFAEKRVLEADLIALKVAN